MIAAFYELSFEMSTKDEKESAVTMNVEQLRPVQRDKSFPTPPPAFKLDEYLKHEMDSYSNILFEENQL